MTQPKAKWIEDNRVLRQKNAYFKRETPKLKSKLDKLTLLLQEQEERHRKEMNAKNYELQKSTDMYDQLHQDFNIVSGLKMQEMLEMVVPYEGL